LVKSVEQSDAPSAVAVRPELEPSSSPILGAGPEGKTMTQTIREKAKIRQNREEIGRARTISRASIWARVGQKGVPDTSKMTEDSKLQTPSRSIPAHDLTAAARNLSALPRSRIRKKNPAEAGFAVLDERARGP
jgi:hypothetical protein